MFFTRAAGMITYKRGSAEAMDFLVGNLTFDGELHDLSFAAIVPVGTKFVQLQVGLMLIGSTYEIRFVEKGYDILFNAVHVITPDAIKPAYARFWIGVDTNRLIEYAGIAPGPTSCDVTVVAWKK